MKKIQHIENVSLHCEGKQIDEQEYQVLVFKNEREVRSITFTKWQNGYCCQWNNSCLGEYNFWKSQKIIDEDTTDVNTGSRNVILIQLQRLISKKKIERNIIPWRLTLCL